MLNTSDDYIKSVDLNDYKSNKLPLVYFKQICVKNDKSPSKDKENVLLEDLSNKCTVEVQTVVKTYMSFRYIDIDNDVRKI